MAKKRVKFKEIASPQVTGVVGYTAEEHETRFKRDYEFNKRSPERAPVNGWEYKYANEGNSSLPPKEVSLIKGSPHSFKGRRTASIYGNRPTTRRVAKR